MNNPWGNLSFDGAHWCLSFRRLNLRTGSSSSSLQNHCKAKTEWLGWAHSRLPCSFYGQSAWRPFLGNDSGGGASCPSGLTREALGVHGVTPTAAVSELRHFSGCRGPLKGWIFSVQFTEAPLLGHIVAGLPAIGSWLVAALLSLHTCLVFFAGWLGRLPLDAG